MKGVDAVGRLVPRTAEVERNGDKAILLEAGGLRFDADQAVDEEQGTGEQDERAGELDAGKQLPQLSSER